MPDLAKKKRFQREGVNPGHGNEETGVPKVFLRPAQQK
jgi:hypothetical protein